MELHQQRVVRFLSRAGAYPHPVGAIQHRETHVSHVFLAGAFAYKLKKAVKFSFLDASTLALRRRFCLLEISLNRRLAPRVYLEVVPVTETPAGLQLGGRGPHTNQFGVGTGRVVEWLVKMRRLPEERMLDRLVASRRVSRSDLVHVADHLVPFFRRAARSRAITHFGLQEQVEELVLGNLRECRPFVGLLLPEEDRRFIEAAYRQYLTLRQPTLARRVRERRIIDGHGDLRCENICLPREIAARGSPSGAISRGLPDVVIFDCVEFQPAFRCGDAANDLSFLAMDLEFRGRKDLAEALLARYRETVDDPTLGAVLPFYQCHRSLVRGKVRGFAWLQHPRSRTGQRVRELSRRHFRLARRYAGAFAPPRLIVVGGLIGTGKSTLAGSIAEALGAVWLRTDEIRLREFARYRRARQPFNRGIYAPHVSELVYHRVIQRAEALIRQGRSVVCDGMFSKAAGRQLLRDIARRHRASFHFFECMVPRAVALRRIATRYRQRSDISQARPEHYDRLRAGFEPVRGWPPREWTRLSDNRPAQATYHAALEALRRAWLTMA